LQIEQPEPALPQNSPSVPGKHCVFGSSPDETLPMQQPAQFVGPHVHCVVAQPKPPQ
jgi:hypothetical protein